MRGIVGWVERSLPTANEAKPTKMAEMVGFAKLAAGQFRSTHPTKNHLNNKYLNICV